MADLYDATVGRVFAGWYGYLMRRIDESGLRETRREVLGEAHGRVLELGSGTGANLALFPDAVDELVLSEPGANMLRALRPRLGERGGRPTELVEAGRKACRSRTRASTASPARW